MLPAVTVTRYDQSMETRIMAEGDVTVAHGAESVTGGGEFGREGKRGSVGPSS